MTSNPVLRSIQPLLQNLKFININREILREVAEKLPKEDLEIPQWRAPIYPDKDNSWAVDFFLLGNCINFAFNEFKTGQTFAIEYNGTIWEASDAMWACLKRAIEDGCPLFDGHYLRNISKNDMRTIFAGGNMEIPKFRERLKIFREVGRVLTQKYDGRFGTLPARARGRLFNAGNGLVELLTANFASFDDKIKTKDHTLYFYKRAQLAGAMLYGRFRHWSGLLKFSDIDDLTIFADYEVPTFLRYKGILAYNPYLAHKVDNNIPLSSQSVEWWEIRACSIQACYELIKIANEIRKKQDNPRYNALHCDYWAWKNGTELPKGIRRPLIPDTIAC